MISNPTDFFKNKEICTDLKNLFIYYIFNDIDTRELIANTFSLRANEKLMLNTLLDPNCK